MREKLTFISASAGTGKTWRLVEEVKRAVKEMRARASGVIATTFTRASANEMQERLASAFHEDGMHQEALDLERGLVSTVHGICFQLLSRFAFEAGISPDIRILEDSEATLLLNRAIDEAVTEDLRQETYRIASRLGQRNQKSGQWGWRGEVKNIIDAARSNDIDFAALPAMAVASWAEMESELGSATSDDLDALLQDRINTVLETISESTKVGTGKYRDLLQDFQRNLSAPGFPWARWADLLSKRPEKQFEPDAESIDAIAQRLGQHSRLQEDLRRYLQLLFDLAAEAGRRFTELKRERGVADFADLEKSTLDLLRNHPSAREILADEIDLLLVDEFQDTSPIQLALFTELGHLADRVIWVGDVKQSIYAFRGADPDLVFRAASGAKHTSALEKSWRSAPNLVELTNRLFAPVFLDRLSLPEKQTIIEAHRSGSPTKTPELEFAEISSGEQFKNGKPKTLSVAKRPAVIADAVEDMLQRGEEVVVKASVTEDNREGTTRPLEPGDLAILVRTRDHGAAIAETLRSRGHDVALAGSGLLATPEANLALACLRRWLDPGDSLAATEIIALEAKHEVDRWLEDRLRYIRDRTESEVAEPWLLDSSPTLMALHESAVAHQAETSCPPTLLSAFNQAVSATDLEHVISRWGPTPTRSEQRLANLEQLRIEIEDYESHSAGSGLPATFNGLFGYLEDMAAAKEDKLPTFRSRGAIHIGTYHTAKGLEWPHVYLADLDFTSRSRLFGLRVTASDSDLDYDDPLVDRELRLWLTPFGPKQKHPMLETLEDSATGQQAQRDENNEALRLLYVAFTRARDRLILLHDPAKSPDWLHELGEPAATALLDSSAGLSLPDPNGASHTFPRTVRRYEAREEALPPPPAATLDLPVRSDSRTARQPASLTPSAQLPIDSATIGEVVDYGPRIEWRGHPNETDLGNAMHRIIAAEVLHPGRPDRESRIHTILASFSLDEYLEATAIAQAVDRYLKFIREKFDPTSQRVEIPFSVVNHQGQRISGFIDHLLETEAGPVIIDHKIFPGKRRDWEATALSYSGQLALYRDAVNPDHAPLTFIHFVTSGALVRVSF